MDVIGKASPPAKFMTLDRRFTGEFEADMLLSAVDPLMGMGNATFLAVGGNGPAPPGERPRPRREVPCTVVAMDAPAPSAKSEEPAVEAEAAEPLDP